MSTNDESKTASAPVPVWSTSMLLQCAAIGAVSAVLIVALTPVTYSLALLSPVLYAFVGSISSFGPLVAARWLRAPGSMLLTAVIAGVLAIPFTPLGFLIVIALGLPALVGELVLLLGRFSHTRRETVWYLAVAVFALTLFAISLVVIDPSALSAWVVVLTLLGRLASLLVLAYLATRVERALARAGVRRRRDDRSSA
jgi:hypothetical protein